MGSLLTPMAEGTIAMLPPAHALVPQSKAFLALLWELEAAGLLSARRGRGHHAATLRAPPSARSPSVADRTSSSPISSAKDVGVRFSTELGSRERRRLLQGPVVCQERLEITAAPVARGDGPRLDSERPAT